MIFSSTFEAMGKAFWYCFELHLLSERSEIDKWNPNKERIDIINSPPNLHPSMDRRYI